MHKQHRTVTVNESRTIVLASSNQGKLREIKNILAPFPYQLRPQSEFSVDDADETGLTFIENALIKARHACEQTGHIALADDSGLEVDALQGAPGIYSARYAGEHGDHAANNAKLLNALQSVPEGQRLARFHCVIVLLRHSDDPTPIICQGCWHGAIATAPCGSEGFGYDPLFYLSQYNCTAAELSNDMKNRISHRALALQQLTTQLQHLSASH